MHGSMAIRLKRHDDVNQLYKDKKAKSSCPQKPLSVLKHMAYNFALLTIFFLSFVLQPCNFIDVSSGLWPCTYM